MVHPDLLAIDHTVGGACDPYDGPGGPTKVFSGAGAVTESGQAFSPRRLSIPAGKRIRWTFEDRSLHDATLVTGPRGFSSPPMRGGVYSHRFLVAGTYKVYCSLHPIDMQQVVTVR